MSKRESSVNWMQRFVGQRPFPACKTRIRCVSVLILFILFGVTTHGMAQDGLSFYQQGDFEAAARAFRYEIQRGEVSSIMYDYLGESLIRLNRYGEAQEVLEEFLRLSPGDSAGRSSLGIVHFSQLLPKQARDAFLKSLKGMPDQPRVLKHLAKFQVALGEYAAAGDALFRAARLDPGDFETHYLLGRLYQTQGRLDEAVLSFMEATTLNPQSARAFAYLGTVHFGMGEAEVAIACLRRVFALNANRSDPDFFAHLEYGIYLLRMGNLKESLGQLREAQRLAPLATEVSFELAPCLYRLGNLTEARHVLEQALETAPKEPRLLYLLGRVCYELDDQECGERESTLSEFYRKGP